MQRDRRGNAIIPSGTRIGEYEVTGRLAEGGLGVLFFATHQSQCWVLKTFRIDPDWDSDQEHECREYFAYECAVHPLLHHENIVEARPSFLCDSEVVLPIRFARGGSLRALMTRDQPLATVSRVVRVLEDIGCALDYLAVNGLVHRDVSPSNILLESDGRALLADFGFVRKAGIDSSTRSTESGMSYGIGRWAYGAPEMFDGRDDKYDHRVDIYSLGAVAITLLTGHPPRRWPPRKYRPDLAKALADLLWAMVDDGPDSRPSWEEIRTVIAPWRGPATQGSP